MHDAACDEPLVGPLQTAIDGSLPVVRERDPVALEGILGSMLLLIGPRFHALVSALSQGVPCFSTSWSHKYQMLFEDYGCPDCVLPVTASQEEIRRAVACLTEEPTCRALVTRIRRAAEQQARKADEMWREVDRVLDIG